MTILNLKNLSGAMLMALACVISSCETDVAAPATIADADATEARATYSSRTVNFDNRSDGTYTSSAAGSDFGNVSGWDDSNAYISGGTCRVKLLANSLSAAGGMIANIDIPDDDAYEVTFSVRYHSSFDWSRGGKVGFGLRIGEGNTGCDRADDGNGGSARLMWYQDNSNRVFFRPYVYYKDMPGNCGDDFGKTYPSSGSLTKGTWYTVKILVRSNSGTSSNGAVTFTVNGTTVHSDTTFRWTTNDTQRLIKTLAFHTFRGGSDSYWQSSGDHYIYYDNVSWKSL
jgi:hypothetical protein